MLQNPRKTMGFKKYMVYEIPLGVGKPYLASGLNVVDCQNDVIVMLLIAEMCCFLRSKTSVLAIGKAVL